MKTVFNDADRRGLTSRMERLTGQERPIWGKMSSPQMVKHCRLWEEMIHENKQFRRPLIGRLIGPMILKKVLRSPEFRKNSPTIPEMRVTEATIDFYEERRRLIALIESYDGYHVLDNSFIHPFFGRMTRVQIGQMAYLHHDHHLKQFGI